MIISQGSTAKGREPLEWSAVIDTILGVQAKGEGVHIWETTLNYSEEILWDIYLGILTM